MSLSRPHSLSLPPSLPPSLLFLPVFICDHFNNYMSVVSVSVSVCVCILHTPFAPFSSPSLSPLPSLPLLSPSSVTSTGFLFHSSFSAPPSLSTSPFSTSPFRFASALRYPFQLSLSSSHSPSPLLLLLLTAFPPYSSISFPPTSSSPLFPSSLTLLLRLSRFTVIYFPPIPVFLYLIFRDPKKNARFAVLSSLPPASFLSSSKPKQEDSDVKKRAAQTAPLATTETVAEVKRA
jgi:hypothetical protein